jgi:hypothetical protein
MVSSANFSQMKVGFDMKKFLLASVAALFVATPASARIVAAWGDPSWDENEND